MADDEGTPLKDAAAILWDEARRQNVAQMAEVDLLRSRAVAILSIAALVAGLFGGRILSTQHHPTRVTLAVAAALLCFALGVVAVLAVLMPKWKWEFAHDLSGYFADLKAGNLRPLEVTQNLAEWFEGSTVKNKVILDRLYRYFGVACVLVGLQVVAWGIAVL